MIPFASPIRMTVCSFNRVLQACLLVLGLGATGCVADVEEMTAEGRSQEPLLGHTGYASDCSGETRAMLEKVHLFGRIAASSPAYQQCIRRAFGHDLAGGGAMPGRYRRCNGDPFYYATPDEQMHRVIDMSSSLNDVSMQCSGVPAPLYAWASHGDYWRTDTEHYQWNGPYLTRWTRAVGQPTCDDEPLNPDCADAPYPWPFPQLAGIAWHEVAHQHGYRHGANDQTNALAECGYTIDPTWHFQVNTIPYIVGSCINATLMESHATCGGLESASCGPDALRIVDQLGGTSCSCIWDPGWKTIGGAALEVSVGAQGIFATYPGNGNILRFDGTTWTPVGGPGSQFVQNVVALYGLTPSRDAIYELSPSGWRQISGPMASIIASPTGAELFAVSTSGDILRYEGAPFVWTTIGGPGRKFVAGSSTLYAINLAGEVMQFDGLSWTRIGGGSSDIIVGNDTLYSIRPTDGHVWRYEGAPFAWTEVGIAGRMFVANDTALYKLGYAGEVHRLAHGAGAWTKIAGQEITRLFAGYHYLIAEHSSGDLMRLASP